MTGGIVRPARRPPGWVAPGPRPPESPPEAEFWPRPGEDLCWLSGDWRILQRIDGHRWSLDDLLTAAVAADELRDRTPAQVADLGCGIGTVLMMLAWRFPAATVVGVEAQDTSVDLAQRSLRWNGVVGRCEIRHGDLRDTSLLPESGCFDLVTGTPPYFPCGTGTESGRPQFGPCHFEHRGGLEDYCAAAARLLRQDGVFVFCAGATQRDRVQAAVEGSGLTLHRRVEVVPRAGKAPLLSVHAAHLTTGLRPGLRDETLVVRDRDGQRTPAFQRLRREMGLPP